MNVEGFIKLHRKFQNWEWFQIPEMVQLFIYLLINANVQDTQWRGVPIKRGQLIRGRKKIEADTGLSEQRIKTCLNRLRKTGEIETEIIRNVTDQGTLITICNYESYQQVEKTEQPTSNRPATDLYPTSNRPLTDLQPQNKNDKNDKNNIINPLPPIGGEVVCPPDKPKKAKKEKTINSLCREVFEEHYEKTFGTAYYWTAKDSGSMSQLVNKLTHNRKAKGLSVEDAEIVNALKAFLSYIQSGWIYEHFSVANLNSQFNELVAQIQTSIKNNGASTIIRTDNQAADKQRRQEGVARIIARLNEENNRALGK